MRETLNPVLRQCRSTNQFCDSSQNLNLVRIKDHFTRGVNIKLISSYLRQAQIANLFLRSRKSGK